MAHWYTADPHFGHEAILAHAGRPFRSIEHMDATMIERLWTRVGPEDDLWIVGDFAFGPKAKDEDWLLGVFAQLPGARKHLVIGNHDLGPTLALPWDSIAPLAEVPDPEAERKISEVLDNARRSLPGLSDAPLPDEGALTFHDDMAEADAREQDRIRLHLRHA